MPPPLQLRIGLRPRSKKNSPSVSNEVCEGSEDGAGTSQAQSPASNSNQASCSKSTDKEKRCKSLNWRDKMKLNDPKRYARILEYGKTYGKLQRLNMTLATQDLKKRNLSAEEKEEAEKMVTKLKEYNAGCARRMRKMRARKKIEEQSMTKKPATRAQQEIAKKKRAAVAAKRRKERASMTPKQREAYLKNRRRLYALKKKKAEAEALAVQKRQLNEEKRRLEEMTADLDDEMLQIQEMRDSLQEVQDVRTPAARRKALQRVRKVMPKKAKEYANTTDDLIRKATPTKAAALGDLKMRSPSPRKRFQKAMEEVVATGLAQPKQSTLRRSLGSAMHVLKKHKLIRQSARKFGVSRKLLSNAKKLKAGRRPLPNATVQAVRQFYDSLGKSIPDKKMVSKKTGRAAKLIDRSIQKAYELFKDENPNITIGIARFHSLRPKHIKTQRQGKSRGCLCEYCTNVSLKLEVLNVQLAGVNAPQFSGIYDIANATMCNKPLDKDYHHPDCVQRTCELCGIKMIEERLAPLSTLREKEVHWKKWELVSQKVQGAAKSEVRKRALVTKTNTMEAMLEELQEELEPFPQHLMNKDWQNAQLQYLRKHLPEDSCLSVLDFAENYKCSHQDEVQGAYWTQNSATVHPIVCYYHCTTCQEVVTESLVFITDDLNHDFHAVNAFQTMAFSHLTGERQLKLKQMFRFSDGCGSQYKSKGPFSDVSYGLSDFGVPIHHNFAGSRHGKGASDGESAVVKSAATTAVNAGAAIIRNAQELYEYSLNHLTKYPDVDSCTHFLRTSFYIPSESIDRERAHRQMKTVPGTMKLHSIKTVRDGVVATRNLSCFCPACLYGNGACQNSLYVKDWREVNLHNTVGAEPSGRDSGHREHQEAHGQDSGHRGNQEASGQDSGHREHPEAHGQDSGHREHQEASGQDSGHRGNQDAVGGMLVPDEDIEHKQIIEDPTPAELPEVESELEAVLPTCENSTVEIFGSKDISDDLTVVEVSDLEISLAEVLASMMPDNPPTTSAPTDEDGTASGKQQDIPALTSRICTEGDFVLAKLPMGKRHATYVAEVLKLDGEDVQLKYMEQIKPGIYKWPAAADISTEPVTNIVEKMPMPTLIEEMSSSRVQCFKFV